MLSRNPLTSKADYENTDRLHFLKGGVRARPELFPIVMFALSIASLAPRMDRVLPTPVSVPCSIFFLLFWLCWRSWGQPLSRWYNGPLRSVAPSDAIPQRRQVGVTETVQRGRRDGVAK